MVGLPGRLGRAQAGRRGAHPGRQDPRARQELRAYLSAREQLRLGYRAHPVQRGGARTAQEAGPRDAGKTLWLGRRRRTDGALARYPTTCINPKSEIRNPSLSDFGFPISDLEYAMPKGYLLLVLHAHLPYVRHP